MTDTKNAAPTLGREVDRIVTIRRRLLWLVLTGGAVASGAAATQRTEVAPIATVLFVVLAIGMWLLWRDRVRVSRFEQILLGVVTAFLSVFYGLSLLTIELTTETEMIFELFQSFRSLVLLSALSFYALRPRSALIHVVAVTSVWIIARAFTLGLVTEFVHLNEVQVNVCVTFSVIVGVLYTMASSTTLLSLSEQDLTDALTTRRRIQSMAAHDLRGPLSVVRAGLETVATIGDRMEPEARQEVLRAAISAADRITVLSNDLINEAAEVLPPSAWIERPLGELIGAAVEGSRIAAADVRIEDSKLDHDLPVTVPFVAVVRVLMNLLDNAAKYGRPPVTIDARTQADALVLTVDDAGDGVPKDVAAAAFEPYSRSRKHTEDDGFGLGLTIVANLVASFGGTVTLARGTSCFELRVPFAPPA